MGSAGADREQTGSAGADGSLGAAETARVLVRKKLRSMSGLETPVATRRLVGMLARKGYAPGTAYSVVREELAARGDEVDELDGAGGAVCGETASAVGGDAAGRAHRNIRRTSPRPNVVSL